MQGSDKGILEEALILLEEKITVDCAPSPIAIEISSQQNRAIFGQEVPMAKLRGPDGYQLLSAAMDVIANGINAHEYLTSVPLMKPLGTSFADVASGKKVHLRMVTYYQIEHDSFIAKFDCMVTQPVAVEVAA